nr:putative capsid [Marmot picobirnavirus]
MSKFKQVVKKSMERNARAGKAMLKASEALINTGLPAVGKVIDLIRIIKNHPEWYTNYSTSNFIQMNLASKQGVIYPQLTTGGQALPAPVNIKTKMPSVAQLRFALTVPQGDQDGWKSGIRLLWQQLRTANSGRINFTVPDLEKYVLNVRAMHYFCAILNRLYRATYTFRSTNSEFPKKFIEAMGFNFNDIMDNAADIFMYTQRFHEQVRVSFPLNIPLYDRTHWLFENVFADSTSDKPSFYVPICPRSLAVSAGAGEPFRATSYTIPMWYDPSNSDSTSTTLTTLFDPISNIYGDTGNYGFTWDGYKSCIDAAKTRMIESTKMSNIAADIIKAFGDSAFSPLIVTTGISEGLTAIYDENALNQLQNATVLLTNLAGQYSTLSLTDGENSGSFNVTYNNLESMSISLGEYRYVPIIQNDEQGWVSMTLRAILPDTINDVSIITDAIAERHHNYMVNWHQNTISPGQVMSITRLVCGGYNLDTLEIGNGPAYNVHVESFTTFGTEVLLSAYTLCDFEGLNYDEDNEGVVPHLIPIAGAVIFNTRTPNNNDSSQIRYGRLSQNLVYSFWAMFDNAPRLIPRYAELIDSDSTGIITFANEQLGSEVLDWDVFATLDETSRQNYLSYGNQSITYAGPSQNQSNSSVYTHGSMKSRNNSKSNSTHATITQDKQ